MMIGEENQQNSLQISPGYPFDDSRGRIVFPLQGISVNDDFNSNSVSEEYSPLFSREALMKYQGYIPSNDEDNDLSIRESDIPIDAYSCDEFRIYEFKITRCVYGKSHDWTECPFAHPGEKARRRDPRKVHYSGTACPDFRKGNCKRGDSCEFAHGVFECWLHPTRYRTQPCKDGTSCRRRVCFFAHTPEQLRVLPQPSPRTPVSTESYDGSPSRFGFDSFMTKGSIMPSPMISPASESPPMSPNGGNLSRSLGSNSVNEVLNSLRNLQLNKVKSVSSSWGVQIGSGFCSPRSLIVRPGFYSLPSTPTRSGPGYLDFWERNSCVEEPVMERVESGRDLRAKIYEKLSKENLIEGVKSPSSSLPPVPDVGWVSELVK